LGLIVKKFGGTSVGSTERIRAVAAKVVESRRAGDDVIVVVSAMAGETNRLVSLARDISKNPIGREYDVLVATGEQVSIALLSLAIKELGVEAESFLAHQVRIMTSGTHGKARIESIAAPILRAALEKGKVCVVAGFQGMDADGSITTLGRGGSDTTAVALAAAMEADVCEIYTDVDGIYTTDPNIVRDAQKIDRVSYEEMLELASLGAKVLQTRSVEFALNYQVPVHVRSSFSSQEGSWVVPEEETMEKVAVRAVTCDRNQVRVTVVGLPDEPGVAVRLFKPLSASDIVVDMIIQNASREAGRTDMTFTVTNEDLACATKIVQDLLPEVGGQGFATDPAIAKVSVVGVGMRSHSGVATEAFAAMSEAGVNIKMISTSEIKISMVVDERYSELAVRALHDCFNLGSAAPSTD
jgi:aspartate kinase